MRAEATRYQSTSTSIQNTKAGDREREKRRAQRKGIGRDEEMRKGRERAKQQEKRMGASLNFHQTHLHTRVTRVTSACDHKHIYRSMDIDRAVYIYIYIHMYIHICIIYIYIYIYTYVYMLL